MPQSYWYTQAKLHVQHATAYKSIFFFSHLNQIHSVCVSLCIFTECKEKLLSAAIHHNPVRYWIRAVPTKFAECLNVLLDCPVWSVNLRCRLQENTGKDIIGFKYIQSQTMNVLPTVYKLNLCKLKLMLSLVTNNTDMKIFISTFMSA